MAREGSSVTSEGGGATTWVVTLCTECFAVERSEGGGATTDADIPASAALCEADGSGGGAITCAARLGALRLISCSIWGGGATMASVESAVTVVEDFRPSAGGGPGTCRNASRFFTGSAEIGSFRSGASTTFSVT